MACEIRPLLDMLGQNVEFPTDVMHIALVRVGGLEERTTSGEEAPLSLLLVRHKTDRPLPHSPWGFFTSYLDRHWRQAERFFRRLTIMRNIVDDDVALHQRFGDASQLGRQRRDQI